MRTLLETDDSAVLAELTSISTRLRAYGETIVLNAHRAEIHHTRVSRMLGGSSSGSTSAGTAGGALAVSAVGDEACHRASTLVPFHNQQCAPRTCDASVRTPTAVLTTVLRNMGGTAGAELERLNI